MKTLLTQLLRSMSVYQLTDMKKTKLQALLGMNVFIGLLLTGCGGSKGSSTTLSEQLRAEIVTLESDATVTVVEDIPDLASNSIRIPLSVDDAGNVVVDVSVSSAMEVSSASIYVLQSAESQTLTESMKSTLATIVSFAEQESLSVEDLSTLIEMSPDMDVNDIVEILKKAGVVGDHEKGIAYFEIIGLEVIEKAAYIKAMYADNAAGQAELIKAMYADNAAGQAELIKAMYADNAAGQAELIKAMYAEVADQAALIKAMDLNTESEAELINQMDDLGIATPDMFKALDLDNIHLVELMTAIYTDDGVQQVALVMSLDLSAEDLAEVIALLSDTMDNDHLEMLVSHYKALLTTGVSVDLSDIRLNDMPGKIKVELPDDKSVKTIEVTADSVTQIFYVDDFSETDSTSVWFGFSGGKYMDSTSKGMYDVVFMTKDAVGEDWAEEDFMANVGEGRGFSVNETMSVKLLDKEGKEVQPINSVLSQLVIEDIHLSTLLSTEASAKLTIDMLKGIYTATPDLFDRADAAELDMQLNAKIVEQLKSYLADDGSDEVKINIVKAVGEYIDEIYESVDDSIIQMWVEFIQGAGIEDVWDEVSDGCILRILQHYAPIIQRTEIEYNADKYHGEDILLMNDNPELYEYIMSEYGDKSEDGNFVDRIEIEEQDKVVEFSTLAPLSKGVYEGTPMLKVYFDNGNSFDINYPYSPGQNALVSKEDIDNFHLKVIEAREFDHASVFKSTGKGDEGDDRSLVVKIEGNIITMNLTNYEGPLNNIGVSKIIVPEGVAIVAIEQHSLPLKASTLEIIQSLVKQTAKEIIPIDFHVVLIRALQLANKDEYDDITTESILSLIDSSVQLKADKPSDIPKLKGEAYKIAYYNSENAEEAYLTLDDVFNHLQKAGTFEIPNSNHKNIDVDELFATLEPLITVRGMSFDDTIENLQTVFTKIEDNFIKTGVYSKLSEDSIKVALVNAIMNTVESGAYIEISDDVNIQTSAVYEFIVENITDEFDVIFYQYVNDYCIATAEEKVNVILTFMDRHLNKMSDDAAIKETLDNMISEISKLVMRESLNIYEKDSGLVNHINNIVKKYDESDQYFVYTQVTEKVIALGEIIDDAGISLEELDFMIDPYYDVTPSYYLEYKELVLELLMAVHADGSTTVVKSTMMELAAIEGGMTDTQMLLLSSAISEFSTKDVDTIGKVEWSDVFLDSDSGLSDYIVNEFSFNGRYQELGKFWQISLVEDVTPLGLNVISIEKSDTEVGDDFVYLKMEANDARINGLMAYKIQDQPPFTVAKVNQHSYIESSYKVEPLFEKNTEHENYPFEHITAHEGYLYYSYWPNTKNFSYILSKQHPINAISLLTSMSELDITLQAVDEGILSLPDNKFSSSDSYSELNKAQKLELFVELTKLNDEAYIISTDQSLKVVQFEFLLSEIFSDPNGLDVYNDSLATATSYLGLFSNQEAVNSESESESEKWDPDYVWNMLNSFVHTSSYGKASILLKLISYCNENNIAIMDELQTQLGNTQFSYLITYFNIISYVDSLEELTGYLNMLKGVDNYDWSVWETSSEADDNLISFRSLFKAGYDDLMLFVDLYEYLTTTDDVLSGGLNTENFVTDIELFTILYSDVHAAISSVTSHEFNDNGEYVPMAFINFIMEDVLSYDENWLDTQYDTAIEELKSVLLLNYSHVPTHFLSGYLNDIINNYYEAYQSADEVRKVELGKELGFMLDIFKFTIDTNDGMILFNILAEEFSVANLGADPADNDLQLKLMYMLDGNNPGKTLAGIENPNVNFGMKEVQAFKNVSIFIDTDIGNYVGNLIESDQLVNYLDKLPRVDTIEFKWGTDYFYSFDYYIYLTLTETNGDNNIFWNSGPIYVNNMAEYNYNLFYSHAPHGVTTTPFSLEDIQGAVNSYMIKEEIVDSKIALDGLDLNINLGSQNTSYGSSWYGARTAEAELLDQYGNSISSLVIEDVPSIPYYEKTVTINQDLLEYPDFMEVLYSSLSGVIVEKVVPADILNSEYLYEQITWLLQAEDIESIADIDTLTGNIVNKIEALETKTTADKVMILAYDEKVNQESDAQYKALVESFIDFSGTVNDLVVDDDVSLQAISHLDQDKLAAAIKIHLSNEGITKETLDSLFNLSLLAPTSSVDVVREMASQQLLLTPVPYPEESTTIDSFEVVLVDPEKLPQIIPDHADIGLQLYFGSTSYNEENSVTVKYNNVEMKSGGGTSSYQTLQWSLQDMLGENDGSDVLSVDKLSFELKDEWGDGWNGDITFDIGYYTPTASVWIASVPLNTSTFTYYTIGSSGDINLSEETKDSIDSVLINIGDVFGIRAPELSLDGSGDDETVLTLKISEADVVGISNKLNPNPAIPGVSESLILMAIESFVATDSSVNEDDMIEYVYRIFDNVNMLSESEGFVVDDDYFIGGLTSMELPTSGVEFFYSDLDLIHTQEEALVGLLEQILFQIQTAFLYDEITPSELGFALYDLYYLADELQLSLNFESPWVDSAMISVYQGAQNSAGEYQGGFDDLNIVEQDTLSELFLTSSSWAAYIVDFYITEDNPDFSADPNESLATLIRLAGINASQDNLAAYYPQIMKTLVSYYETTNDAEIKANIIKAIDTILNGGESITGMDLSFANRIPSNENPLLSLMSKLVDPNDALYIFSEDSPFIPTLETILIHSTVDEGSMVLPTGDDGEIAKEITEFVQLASLYFNPTSWAYDTKLTAKFTADVVQQAVKLSENSLVPESALLTLKHHNLDNLVLLFSYMSHQNVVDFNSGNHALEANHSLSFSLLNVLSELNKLNNEDPLNIDSMAASYLQLLDLTGHPENIVESKLFDPFTLPTLLVDYMLLEIIPAFFTADNSLNKAHADILQYAVANGLLNRVVSSSDEIHPTKKGYDYLVTTSDGEVITSAEMTQVVLALINTMNIPADNLKDTQIDAWYFISGLSQNYSSLTENNSSYYTHAVGAISTAIETFNDLGGEFNPADFIEITTILELFSIEPGSVTPPIDESGLNDIFTLIVKSDAYLSYTDTQKLCVALAYAKASQDDSAVSLDFTDFLESVAFSSLLYAKIQPPVLIEFLSELKTGHLSEYNTILQYQDAIDNMVGYVQSQFYADVDSGNEVEGFSLIGENIYTDQVMVSENASLILLEAIQKKYMSDESIASLWAPFGDDLLAYLADENNKDFIEQVPFGYNDYNRMNLSQHQDDSMWKTFFNLIIHSSDKDNLLVNLDTFLGSFPSGEHIAHNVYFGYSSPGYANTLIFASIYDKLIELYNEVSEEAVSDSSQLMGVPQTEIVNLLELYSDYFRPPDESIIYDYNTYNSSSDRDPPFESQDTFTTEERYAASVNVMLNTLRVPFYITYDYMMDSNRRADEYSQEINYTGSNRWLEDSYEGDSIGFMRLILADEYSSNSDLIEPKVRLFNQSHNELNLSNSSSAGSPYTYDLHMSDLVAEAFKGMYWGIAKWNSLAAMQDENPQLIINTNVDGSTVTVEEYYNSETPPFEFYNLNFYPINQAASDEDVNIQPGYEYVRTMSSDHDSGELGEYTPDDATYSVETTYTVLYAYDRATVDEWDDNDNPRLQFHSGENDDQGSLIPLEDQNEDGSINHSDLSDWEIINYLESRGALLARFSFKDVPKFGETDDEKPGYLDATDELVGLYVEFDEVELWYDQSNFI